MNFEECVREWVGALNQEIKHLKEQGGKKHRVNEGRLLRKTDGRNTYMFLLNSEVSFPDGSAVRVEIGNLKITGEVVSVEGFDIILDLSDYLGEYVEEADLFSEPWNILVELIYRLLDLIDTTNASTDYIGNLVMAKRTLGTRHKNRLAGKEFSDIVDEICARSLSNPTTYIWGPPGTGKTHTLANVTIQHLKRARSVLILSHSNAAVDGLMDRIANIKKSWNPGEIVRFGLAKLNEVANHPNLLASKLVEFHNPDLKKKKSNLVSQQRALRKAIKNNRGDKQQELLLAQIEDELRELRGLIRDMEDSYVERANVLGVTLSKAIMSPLIYKKKYDLVIIDEASMAFVPQVVFAASLANRNVVVCGDFKQLPPIAMSDHRLVNKWLRKDIFEVSRIVSAIAKVEEHPNLVMLQTQRRMHRKISSFANLNFYHGKLLDHDSVQERIEVAKLGPLENEAFAILDLSRLGANCLQEHAGNSRFNMLSAMIAVQLMGIASSQKCESIGYIAPYNAQARLVTSLIHELLTDDTEDDPQKRFLAATVHKFQGSERDMIFYDAVDSYPKPRASILHTNSDSERLVNVAVTRARGKFVQLADVKYLSERLAPKNASRKLIDYAINVGPRVTRFELPNVLKKHKINNLDWYQGIEESELFADLLSARSEVIVSLPSVDGVSFHLWETLARLKQSIRVTVISPDVAKVPALINWEVIPANFSSAFTLIDRETLWYGAPLFHHREDTGAKKPYIIGRLKAPRTIKMFVSFLGNSITQKTQQEIAAATTSLRANYGLKQYLLSWGSCSQCGSTSKGEVTSSGKVVLRCSHCGKVGRLTVSLINRYLDYVDLNCRVCNGPYKANNATTVECTSCDEKFDIHSLW